MTKVYTDEFKDFAMWYWKENCKERQAYGEETLTFKEYCEKQILINGNR